ncbi:MAG: amino acid permease, partial [Desulfobacterales bacterium]|nr:amino acid permease [Desulfobacterales bacterium]
MAGRGKTGGVEKNGETTGGLGTFAGVFTPSILTILGIILFLRLGYVVGNAGLGRALIMIGLANLISILTSFSLAAIATNLKVKGGGDYYLISRTLGVEFGGAIGLVLFLAQSVSIAFYCIGFGEAAAGMLFPGAGEAPRLIAAAAVMFLFVFAWLGADWASKFQYVVMFFLILALASFFIGGIARWDGALLAENWAPPGAGPDFWILFAVLFPAVTGFTQGVSMSGDLKDPGKSLPMGTFLAVGASIIVYIGAMVVFSAAVPGDLLRQDFGAMKRAARVGPLIDAGVIAATLSSAMASFLGAPRILQALAGDRIFPFLRPFAKGSGPGGNPRRAALLSAVIALGAICLGQLNLIARVVSMFFLISYGLLNYATFYEARAASPSFRPRFRYYAPWLSLLGFLACLGVMMAIDFSTGVAAIAVLFAIYQYLGRTAGPALWADGRGSHHLQQARESLIAAAHAARHPRNWRPNLLAFSHDAPGRERLLRFASWITGKSGTTTAVRILEGEGVKMLKRKAEAELSGDIAAHELEAFPMVVAAPDMRQCLQTLVQSSGIGPLRANTVLVNKPDQIAEGIPGLPSLKYAGNLRVMFRYGINLVIFSTDKERWETLEKRPREKRRIDVWWRDDATGRLMLLFAHLTTRSRAWARARIRVLAVRDENDPGAMMESLTRLLDDARVAAAPEVVDNLEPET